MLYGTIEGIDKPVSRIVLGTAVGRMQRGQNADDVFDAALEAGINAIDTARCYMGSEKVIGGWLARRRTRERVVLITKGGDYGLLGNGRLTERCVRADIQKSLATLRTDYADLYFLHKDDESRPVGALVELLASLKAEGKIRAYGVSNWRYERIVAANEYAAAHSLSPVVASQVQYSLAVAEEMPWRGCYSLTGEKRARERAWYGETGLALFAYCPLGRGLLSGKFTYADRTRQNKAMDGAARRAFASERNFQILRRAEEIAAQLGVGVPAVSLAWILRQNLNAFAVVGSGSAASVKRNLNAADVRLTEGQIRYLLEG